MKASAKEYWGNDSLSGKKILVQGVGHVGEYLVSHLVKENAEVMIADIYEDRVKAVVAKYGVKVIDIKDVYSTPMDIYSPCALGATVNDETLSQLKCSIICGAANNQLGNEAVHGVEVQKRVARVHPHIDFLSTHKQADGVARLHDHIPNRCA
jgi:leucine dehydrogenase